MRHVSAILLAAGRSSRMGQLKGFLPWEGKPLIEWQITQLQQSLVSEIVVVLGYEADRYKQILQPYRVRSICNTDYDEGKTSSIVQGLKAISPQAEAILVAAVDQPLREQTINRMIQHMSHTGKPIVIPVYEKKRGHPVLFSAILKEQLMQISEKTQGLKNVIRTHNEHVSELHMDDPYVSHNFNRPSDYLSVASPRKR